MFVDAVKGSCTDTFDDSCQRNQRSQEELLSTNSYVLSLSMYFAGFSSKTGLYGNYFDKN